MCSYGRKVPGAECPASLKIERWSKAGIEWSGGESTTSIAQATEKHKDVLGRRRHVVTPYVVTA